jgi:hypothetical protein
MRRSALETHEVQERLRVRCDYTSPQEFVAGAGGKIARAIERNRPAMMSTPGEVDSSCDSQGVGDNVLIWAVFG